MPLMSSAPSTAPAVVPGQAIGQQVYNPNAKVQVISTVTAFADVDAANAAVSAAAPSSGAVVVEVSTLVVGNNTGAGGAWWCLREGAAIVAGTVTNVLTSGGAGQRVFTYVVARFYVGGLVPGSMHTWKLAHASGSAGDSVGVQYGGNTGAPGDAGPLVMRVLAAS